MQRTLANTVMLWEICSHALLQTTQTDADFWGPTSHPIRVPGGWCCDVCSTEKERNCDMEARAMRPFGRMY